jgi:hypothetical protein
MTHPPFRVLLLAQVLGIGTLAARPPAVVDVLFERHCAADFDRLTRYLAGRPPHFRPLLHRTDADQENGLYAIVLLRGRRGWENATLELELLRAGDPDPRPITVPLGTGKLSGGEIWVGLTDGGWCSLVPEDVLAWRVRILRGGAQLCGRTSFLFPNGGCEETSQPGDRAGRRPKSLARGSGGRQKLPRER